MYKLRQNLSQNLRWINQWGYIEFEKLSPLGRNIFQFNIFSNNFISNELINEYAVNKREKLEPLRRKLPQFNTFSNNLISYQFLIVVHKNHLWAGNYMSQLKTFLKLQRKFHQLNTSGPTLMVTTYTNVWNLLHINHLLSRYNRVSKRNALFKYIHTGHLTF